MIPLMILNDIYLKWVNKVIVAGVDGGGTTTRVALMSGDGNIIGYGVSGPSNYHDVGIETTKQHVNLALKEAWETTNKDPQPLDGIFFGMASVVSKQDRKNIKQIAKQLELAPQSQIGVDHDIRIALAGGLAGRQGINLIVGTGSSCYGRKEDGKNWRCGGWGHILDDLGSAYFLGVQGMIAMVHEADGRGVKTTLTEQLMRKLGISDFQNIMHRLYVKGMSRSEIASLAPLITEMAKLGDQKALEILRKGSDNLVNLIQIVDEKLHFPRNEKLVVVSGGTIHSSPIYKKMLYSTINKRLPGFKVLEPVFPPVVGAALLAFERIRGKPSKSLIQNLQKGIGRYQFNG